MEVKQRITENEIGAVVVFPDGHVLLIEEVDEFEVYGIPFLIDHEVGETVMPCILKADETAIVYSPKEALDIFAAHIAKAKEAGLWTEGDPEGEEEIQLTIPPDTLSRLEAEAKRRETTVNGLINTILSESVDEPVEVAANRF